LFCIDRLYFNSRDLERKLAPPDPWLAALIANRSATAVGAAAVVVGAGRHFAASSVSTLLGPGALGRCFHFSKIKFQNFFVALPGFFSCLSLIFDLILFSQLS
jgi:hypothetical protein